MAYSDYGGYAYKNGERVVERSDWTLTPDGGFESPGMWPGFGAIIAGMDAEEAQKIRSYPSGHAVIGSGPVYVTMYKQNNIHVYHNMDLLFEPEPILDYCEVEDNDDYGYWSNTRFMGYDLRYRSVFIDNYYIFAQLVEPDKTIWTGFSGYGVGAGLEESESHPFDTDMIASHMKRTFPKAFGDVDNPHKSPLSSYYEQGI